MAHTIISLPGAGARRKAKIPLHHRLHTAFTSVYIQSSIQLAAGMFVACLFTYVHPISFPPNSCVMATWFCVVAVMASPTNHVGVRINAAAAITGSTALGAMLAAILTTLCQLIGPIGTPGATAFLGVMAPAVLMVLAINRVVTSPPGLWAEGMNCCLAFGLTVLTTHTMPNISRIWYLAGTLVLSATLSSIVAVLVAALLAPTVATEEVQNSIADVLLLSGVATSRYGARLFRPLQPVGKTQPKTQSKDSADSSAVGAVGAPQGDDSSDVNAVAAAAFIGPAPTDADAAADVALEQLAAAADGLNAVSSGLPDADDSYHLGEAGAALVMKEVHTEAEWLEIIQRNSSPQPLPAATAYSCPMPEAPVASLRPKLFMAQTMMLAAAEKEPQWLQGGWDTIRGKPGCYWFDAPAWGKLAGSLQVLLTRLSALEAVIEDGESLDPYNASGFSPALVARLRSVYSQAATSLSLMSHAVRVYGQKGSTQNPAKQHSPLKGAKRDAADGVMREIAGTFCGNVAEFEHSWSQAKADLSCLIQKEVEHHWETVTNAAADSPVVLPTLTLTRHLFFTWSLTTAVIDTLDNLEKAAAAAVCYSPQPGSGSFPSGCGALLHRLFGWLVPLEPILTSRQQAASWVRVIGQELPRELKHGLAGLRNIASMKPVQAGFKYWLVLTLVFVATLLSLHFDVYIRSVNPGFGFVAASLCMSEKVEATVSKFSFWMAGTLVGGLIGWAAMFHPALALNPYGLVALVVGMSAVVGMLGVTKARVAITLVLMTLSSLILCQCCGHVGNWAISAARVVSVIAGVATSVVVCNLILPWYTSTWAIQVMSSTFVTCVQLLTQLQVQFHAEGAAAVAAYEAKSPWPHPEGSSATDGSSTKDVAPQPGARVAAAAAAAADVAAAAGAASAHAASVGGHGSYPLVVTPAVLQSMVARPLVQVQQSLIMDTVAWQRGVLATPPVVSALLRVMFGLLDRLAALQLALVPPTVTGSFTGISFSYYGVPQSAGVCQLVTLMGQLAVATAAALEQPTQDNAKAVLDLVSATQSVRAKLFSQMQQLRQQLHKEAHERQQQLLQQGDQLGAAESCAVRRHMALLLGSVDDVVRYMGFQFACVKACDRVAAVAKVAVSDACAGRNTQRCTLK